MNTNSQIFKAAHNLARTTKDAAGCYAIAFKCALKYLYTEIKAGVDLTEAALVFLGCKVWAKGNHRRVYLNPYHSFIYKLLNFCIQRENGRLKGSNADGTELSITKTRRIAYGLESAYYDVKRQEFEGSFFYNIQAYIF